MIKEIIKQGIILLYVRIGILRNNKKKIGTDPNAELMSVTLPLRLMTLFFQEFKCFSNNLHHWISSTCPP